MKTLKLTGKLLFWLVLCQLPGLAGIHAVRGNLDWYNTLAFPPFTPPDALFGLAWSVLYVLLGVSAFLVFKGAKNAEDYKPVWPLVIQLALNAAWTPVFFGLHRPGAAFLLLLIMLAQGIWLARAFAPKSRAAAWLLLPYGLWLCYAGYLNMGVWLLNR